MAEIGPTNYCIFQDISTYVCMCCTSVNESLLPDVWLDRVDRDVQSQLLFVTNYVFIFLTFISILFHAITSCFDCNPSKIMVAFSTKHLHFNMVHFSLLFVFFFNFFSFPSCKGE